MWATLAGAARACMGLSRAGGHLAVREAYIQDMSTWRCHLSEEPVMRAMCSAHTTLCPVTRKYLMKGKHTKGEMPAAEQAPNLPKQQASNPVQAGAH